MHLCGDARRGAARRLRLGAAAAGAVAAAILLVGGARADVIGTGAPFLDNTTPHPGDTITVDPDAVNWTSDAGSPSWSFSYDWQRCTNIGCGSLGAPDQSTYTVVPGDVGATIQVVVTGNDGSGVTQAATSAATATIDSGIAIAPALSDDNPSVGEYLTVDPRPSFTGNDSSATPSVEWQSCTDPNDPTTCADIGGAGTGTGYTLTSAEQGLWIRALVTVTGDQTGTSVGPASSELTASAVSSGLAVAPTIDNPSPVVGDTLNATDGVSSTSGYDSSFTSDYQWISCVDVSVPSTCADVGSDQSTYVVQPSDEGDSIGVVVRSSGQQTGASASGTSSGTNLVGSGITTGSPTIDDTAPLVGDTLTANADELNWSGAYDLSFTFDDEWWACSNPSDLSTCTFRVAQPTYTVQAADRGDAILLVVDATGTTTGAVQGAQAPVTQAVVENQTISFAAPSGVTLGQADSDLGAAATSDLAVSYTSTTTGVCTIAGGMLHRVAPGTCTVAADQAGGGGWNPAPQVQRTFTIAKATQTISFAAPSGVALGDADRSLGATATSGLTVTYTSATPSVCTVASGMLRAVSAGSCTIDAYQAGDASYGAAPQVAQTFAIGAAAAPAATVAAAPTSVAAATATPGVTGTVTVVPPSSSGAPTATSVSVDWAPDTFGAVPAHVEVSIATAPSVPGIQFAPGAVVSVQATTAAGAAVASLTDVLDVAIAGAPDDFVPLYSHDGITWTAIPELAGTTLSPAASDGWYRDGSTLHVLTRHLTLFALARQLHVTDFGVRRVVRLAGSRVLAVYGVASLDATETVSLRSHGRTMATWTRAEPAGSASPFRVTLPRALAPRGYVLWVTVAAGPQTVVERAGLSVRP